LHIHPSAVIDPGASLGPGTEVGPSAVIEDGVTVGEGCRVLAGSVLHRGTRLAARVGVGPYAVLGGEPMDSSYRGEESFVDVGEAVRIREFATVHRATGAGEATRIGAGSLLMTYVHVSHNVTVGRDVTLTSGSQLGGHAQVGDGAVLGAGAHLHQFVRVGGRAMIGALAGPNRDALPFMLLHGVFAEHYGLNRVGLERAGFSSERRHLLSRAFRCLRTGDREGVRQLARESEDVQRLLTFESASTRGISRLRSGRR